MADMGITNTFTASTKAIASEVNANFSDVKNYINARNSGGTYWDAILGTVGTVTTLTSTTANLTTANITDSLEKKPLANIRAFGAIGDGTTDDTTAIQAAINSGYPVLIPQGTFICDKITLLSNSMIIGYGPSSILKIKGSSVNTTFITIANKSFITIKGITIDGNLTNQTTVMTAIDANTSGNIVIEGCYIHDVKGNGINFASCSNNKVVNNRLVTLGNTGGIGVTFGTGGSIGGTPSNYNLCALNYIDSTYHDGIYIDLNSAFNSAVGNVILNAGRYGIIMDQSPDNIISDNIIKDCDSISILSTNSTGDGQSSRNKVVNNKIYSSYGVAIQVDGHDGYVQGNVVQGNSIYNSNDKGIFINKSWHTICSNNSITLSKLDGIYVSDSDYSAIVGNVVINSGQLTNNTYYDIYIGGDTNWNTVTGNAVHATEANKVNTNIKEVAPANFNLFVGNTASNGVTARIAISGGGSSQANNLTN